MFFVIGVSFERELASGVDAPGVARRSLSEWFSSALADGTLTTARLLVSELVTNAVTHGTGRITLQAQLSGRRLLVAVLDEGGGFGRACGLSSSGRRPDSSPTSDDLTG